MGGWQGSGGENSEEGGGTVKWEKENGNRVEKYLETVVDVQTRDHHQKPIRVHTAHQGRDHEAIPALVALIQQAIHRIRAQ